MKIHLLLILLAVLPFLSFAQVRTDSGAPITSAPAAQSVELNLPAAYAKKGANQVIGGMSLQFAGLGILAFGPNLVRYPDSPRDWSNPAQYRQYNDKVKSAETKRKVIGYVGLGAITAGFVYNISGVSNFRKAFTIGVQ